MIARAIIVVGVAALLAFQVVRTAAVAHRPSRHSLGAQLWPTHPSVEIDRTMAEIGVRAARGQKLPPATLHQVEEIARKAPLAPEPYLVKGALAQLERRDEAAERLFAAARTRAPRSPAARYFLADRFLRTGRIGPALAEIAVLSRLLPEAKAGFGPALAAFARTPGAVPQLRRFFRSSPEIEPVVLSELASDARNADLILALWGRRDPPAFAPDWKTKLINKLVEQGQFEKAYSTWRLAARVNQARGTIFNPRFAKLVAPPPFNWTFASAGGVVEPSPGDRLQVIYFGRGDAILAEQILLLPPGRYRLGMDIDGPLGKGGEIAWTLACLPSSNPIMRLAVERKGALTGEFSVPQNCPAQRLQLTGTSGEFPQSHEFTVGKLELKKASGT